MSPVAYYNWMVFWGLIRPTVESDWKLFSQHYAMNSVNSVLADFGGM